MKSELIVNLLSGLSGQYQSLLENAEIEAYLKDEFTGVLYPWHTSPVGVGALKVFVSNVDQEKAKMVVEDYESNVKKE